MKIPEMFELAGGRGQALEALTLLRHWFEFSVFLKPSPCPSPRHLSACHAPAAQQNGTACPKVRPAAGEPRSANGGKPISDFSRCSLNWHAEKRLLLI